jgi:predicted MFS family arabinose efflux permease
MITSALVKRGRSSATLGAAAIALTLAAIAAFSIAPAGFALIAIALAWGMGSGANWVLSSADVQRLAPDAYIGRLAAVDDLGATLGMVAGGFVGGAIAEASGSTAPAAWGGIALGAALAVGLFRATGEARERTLATVAAR